MNLRKLLFLITASGLLLAACRTEKKENTFSGKSLFNYDWEFCIDTMSVDTPDGLEALSGPISWQNVSLPHTPRIEPLIVNDQWQGICWYRKKFPTEARWKDKKLFLRFEGAMNVAEVWVNGNLKIKHLGGYLPFVVDISDDIYAEGLNTVYVRLDNRDNPVTGPKPLEILDFNMYGGLYRNVFLVEKKLVFISDEQFVQKKAGGGIFVTYPDVSVDKAQVSVKTHIINAGDFNATIKLEQSIMDKESIVAHKSDRITLAAGDEKDVIQIMEVGNPDLWSPRSPHLYLLDTRLVRKGKVIDNQVNRIGIRKFEFIDNRLFINGEETFLRGVNRHQEFPYVGYAASNNAQFRDAIKIKEAGFDYVRLSHYPHAPAFMDACDELGIVTIDAIPGWQYFNADEAFKRQVMQTARDMIRRDRNHPSVLAWEVSLNESGMPEPFIDSLVTIAHEEYPGLYCYAAGWMKYGYDIFLQARQHRIGHPSKYPDKPYIVSEYGDWEYYALNAGFNQDAWGDLMEGERSSRQLLGSGEKRMLQQALNIQEAHNDNFKTPAVADGYWVMYDYNRGYADDLESSGVMSIFRLPKFSYYFFRSQRDPDEEIGGKPVGPIVFLASYRDENSPDDIRIFSNCEEVELLYNGESFGRQQPDTGRISENLKHPPFTFRNVPHESGAYLATGYINGKEAARHEVMTAGMPENILLEADFSGMGFEAGCNDIIFIYARITDSNGQTVHEYDLPVRISISGNGKIIGDSIPLPEAGVAATLLMAGMDQGEITIRAVSGNIASDPLLIRID